jgi:hypothetical protein
MNSELEELKERLAESKARNLESRDEKVIADPLEYMEKLKERLAETAIDQLRKNVDELFLMFRALRDLLADKGLLANQEFIDYLEKIRK